ncbi:MAG: cyclic nucleotide-binding domain-containing protein [Bdellovibrionaceae bacterium]|nr:cyclic nucleotide-binding domain-containing protein [Pseudobdellovibrionaceae bacterium]
MGFREDTLFREVVFRVPRPDTIALASLKASAIISRSFQTDLAVIEEGHTFGEFALLDKSSVRSASAQALTDVELIKVSEEGFKELLSELPVWAASMMNFFVSRMKKLTAQMRDLRSF